MKAKMLTVFAYTVFICLLPLLSFGQRSQDSLALVALYNATEGSNWTNPWDLSQPISTWYGVTITTEDKLEGIELNRNNLQGALPEELWKLADLTVLDIGQNDLSGSISTSIRNLVNLTHLNFDSNDFEGALPDLSPLNQLKELRMATTGFSGSLSWLGQLTSLENLFAPGNQFTGSIPEEIGALTNLDFINLFGNGLSGSIPTALGNLSNLSGLIIGGNQLSGDIPPELGNLTNLSILDLSHNDLSGLIPVELASLPLTSLRVNDNELGAWIPDFSNNDRLEEITIQNNLYTFLGILPFVEQLSSSVSIEYGSQIVSIAAQVANLKEGESHTIDLKIDKNISSNIYTWFKDDQFYTRIVGDNTLSFSSVNKNDAGTYRTEITNPAAPDLTLMGPISTLQISDVSCQNDSMALVALYNATDGPNWTNPWDLSQPMSTWYGVGLNSRGEVTRVWLDDGYFPGCPQCVGEGNNLVGNIPEEIGLLCQLKELGLSGNSLRGEIPKSIKNLAQLEVLNLSGKLAGRSNNLSGTIPEELSELTQLRHLEIRFQELEGGLPSFLSELTNLESINFNHNNLDGLVPDLSALKKLDFFGIGRNNFHGFFPVWLTELPLVNHINLEENSFSGELPLALGNLLQLRVLSIEDNVFTGTLPPGLGDLRSLFILDLEDNQFTGSIPANYSQLKLHRFDIRNNQITGPIPAFQPNLNPLYIGVENNNLTFSDLLPTIEQISANFDYRYTPQQFISQPTLIDAAAGESVIIDLEVDENSSSNVYTWFKDDQFYTTIVGNNDLVFQSILASDAGVYHCQITNPNVPGLTLVSHDITIQVKNEACRNDSLALVAIYNATGGPNWTHTWDLSQPVHTWYGVTLNANGCVTRLELVNQIAPNCFACSFDGNNLTGTLPADIWNLSELSSLDLSRNFDLSYTLPEDIDKLPLKQLGLGQSGLKGPIPTSIVNLNQLTYLELAGSTIDELPDLSNLQQLKSLYLSGMNLSGDLPFWINNLSNLEDLGLSSNNLDNLNSITWSNLTKLDRLLLADNNFSGEVPDGLWNLPSLEVLTLSNNEFTGQLPSSLANSKIRFMIIRNNFFSGPVPDLSTGIIDITNNLFTFSDLESLFETEVFTGTGFTYAPQKYYAIQDTYSFTQGENPSESINLQTWLDVTQDFSNNNTTTTLSSSNEYAWFKDGQFVSTVTPIGFSVPLPINTPTELSEAGIYTLQITNPNAPELTLTAYEVNVTVTEPINPTQQLFEEYPWLSFIASPENCTNETITVYQTGIFRFLYITNENGSRLFNDQGTLYCTDAPNFDCVAAYNLEEIVATWNCDGDTDTGGESTSEEMATSSALFSDFPWLNELVAVDNCTDQKVSLYQTGIFQFLYIESEGTKTLYNQNGQFYCTSAPNFDCLAAYNLTELLDTWSCSSLQMPSTYYKIAPQKEWQKADLTVFPNPARQEFFIERSKAITPQSIQLVDIMGREIRSIVLNDSLTTVEITDLENGLYFLQYQLEGTTQTVKLLVGN